MKQPHVDYEVSIVTLKSTKKVEDELSFTLEIESMLHNRKKHSIKGIHH